MNFITKEDVKMYVDNKGVKDWEWGGKSSLEGLIEFIWRNYDCLDDELFRDALVCYLVIEGEEPRDYGF